jgi:hypothetical protein
MPESLLRLAKRCAEFLPKQHTKELPRHLRGIYDLA